MTKKEYYLNILVNEEDWTAYLLENSGLPGPRANLELMQAYVELGAPIAMAFLLALIFIIFRQQKQIRSLNDQ